MIMCILQSLKLKTVNTKMIVLFKCVNFQNQTNQKLSLVEFLVLKLLTLALLLVGLLRLLGLLADMQALLGFFGTHKKFKRPDRRKVI